MKRNLLKTFFSLLMLMLGVSAWGDEVTYSIDSKTTVSSTGTAPEGSSATYSQTGNNVGQMTSGNSTTLTLKGYAGMKITGIKLTMKSNTSSGAGTFSVVAGTTTLASISTATTFNKWYDNSSYSTISVPVNVTLTKSDYVIGSEENVVVTLTGTTNSIYVSTYTITYEASKTSGPKAPTISLVAGTFKGSQTATITIPTDATGVQYTTDGTDPTDENNNPELITSNTDVEISSSCTLRAVATDGTSFSSEVSRAYVIKKSIDNTAETAYTVAEAIEKYNDTDNYLDDPVYVKGTVSSMYSTSLASKGYLSYYISADGTTTGDQFEFYQNYKGANSEAWTALTDVAVGDDVIGYGVMTYYNNTTYEFTTGNYLVKHTPLPTVSIEDLAVAIGGTITPAITTTRLADGTSYTMKYESSDNDVVKVSDDFATLSTGTKTGSATITAILSADGYKDATTTFTVTVTSAATLSSITVGGDLTKSTYIVGDDFSFDGLTATGNYSDETTANLTSTVTWTVEPATLTAGTTSVTVKATSGEISGTKNYTVTVNKKASSITIADMEIGKNAADVAISPTTTPADATLTYEITEGSDYITLTDGKISAKVAGTATIKATYAGTDEYASAETTFTVTVSDATFATLGSFSGTSGNINTDVTYEAKKGNASTDPAVYSNCLRLYQSGGYVALTGVKGVKIQSVTLTTSSAYASTTVGYCVDNGTAPTTGETVAASSTYTISGLNNNEVEIYCLGTDKNSRLDIASISVKYTKEDISLSSIALSGDYKTQFDIYDEFNHDNAVVTATYSDNTTADVTDKATFSAPDMTTSGDKTVTVTYTEGGKEVTTSYTINVTGLTPATGDYETVDLTAQSYINAQELTTYRGSSFKMAFSKGEGSTTPKYYTSDNAARCYTDNTITIYGAEAIKGVFVKYVSGYEDAAAETAFDADNNTATITFSQNCRFTSISVWYKDQSIARSTAAGKYGTICAPTVLYADGATLYKVSMSEDNNYVTLTTFEEGEATVAGTPYIYQATETAPTFYYLSGPIVDSPVDAAPLVGVFTETEVPVSDATNIYYVLQTKSDENGGQQFYKVTEALKNKLSANKAYLKLSTSNSGSAKSIGIGFADEDATGISAINALVDGTAKIYDINGRQLKTLQKGVNIVNGVKVLVK